MLFLKKNNEIRPLGIGPSRQNIFSVFYVGNRLTMPPFFFLVIRGQGSPKSATIGMTHTHIRAGTPDPPDIDFFSHSILGEVLTRNTKKKI